MIPSIALNRGGLKQVSTFILSSTVLCRWRFIFGVDHSSHCLVQDAALQIAKAASLAVEVHVSVYSSHQQTASVSVEVHFWIDHSSHYLVQDAALQTAKAVSLAVEVHVWVGHSSHHLV